MNEFRWFVALSEPMYWLIGIVIVTMGWLTSALFSRGNGDARSKITIRQREDHSN